MSGKSGKLKLPSDCTGAAAAALLPRVKEIAEGTNPVYVDAEGVQSIDTTALQILLVLVQHLKTQSRELSWSSLPEPMARQINDGAFAHRLGVEAA